jgi:ribosomal protein S18 acetylase RimI-like enzyme
MLEIRSPQNQEEFAQYYQIRWKTLREPWGEPEGSEKDELEDQALHRAAFLNGKVVGVARIQKNSTQEAQIRYMGVLPEFRGSGIGRKLVESLEDAARDKSFSYIILDSRENAVGFYIVLGYEVVGESYLLFDRIQHYKMKKQL